MCTYSSTDDRSLLQSAHASTLLQSVYHLYSNQLLCDIELLAGNVSIHAHQLVLVTYSQFFSNLFPQITGRACFELDSMDISATSIKILLNYMYTGTLEVLEGTDLEQLKQAAHRLIMEEVLQILTELETEKNVKKENPNELVLETMDTDQDNGISANIKNELIDNLEKADDHGILQQISCTLKNKSQNVTTSALYQKNKRKLRTRKSSTLEKKNAKLENVEKASFRTDKSEEEGDVNTDMDQSNNRKQEDLNESSEETNNVINDMVIYTPPAPVKQFKQHDKLFHCPKCQFKSDNSRTFRRHWLKHTGEKPYKCTLCHKEFTEMKYVKEHLPVHSENRPFKCDSCETTFKTKKNLARHHKNAHREDKQSVLYTCSACNECFKSRTALMLHERSVHDINSLLCTHDGCSYSAASHSDLKKHQVKHIPMDERTKIMCDICGSMFVSPKSLKSHLKFQHLGETLKCTYCDYSTAAKHLMISHYARIHKCDLKGNSVKPKHSCDLCDFKCFQKHEFKCHMLKHSEELPFKCTFCMFSTHMKGTLVKHIRTHTKERPYPCKLCGKSFSNHSTLAMHNRSHMGIKPHKCSLCDKAFASSSTLKEHMFSHQNISPFMCHICCYGCVRKNILRKHIVNKHGVHSLPDNMLFKQGYPALPEKTELPSNAADSSASQVQLHSNAQMNQSQAGWSREVSEGGDTSQVTMDGIQRVIQSSQGNQTLTIGSGNHRNRRNQGKQSDNGSEATTDSRTSSSAQATSNQKDHGELNLIQRAFLDSMMSSSTYTCTSEPDK